MVLTRKESWKFLADICTNVKCQLHFLLIKPCTKGHSEGEEEACSPKQNVQVKGGALARSNLENPNFFCKLLYLVKIAIDIHILL